MTCDCRYTGSRAARRILYEHLYHFVYGVLPEVDETDTTIQYHDHHVQHEEEYNEKEHRSYLVHSLPNLFDLLQSTIITTYVDSDNIHQQENDDCPLLPIRDLYYQDENQGIRRVKKIPKSQRFGATPSVSHYSSSSSSSSNSSSSSSSTSQWWYQCTYCSKIFSSLFYLDQHLDRQHSSTRLLNNNNSLHPHLNDTHEVHTLSVTEAHPRFLPFHNDTTARPHHHHHHHYQICPAITWCETLYTDPSLCHEYAMYYEPFYGPGSNGLHHTDRQTLHRRDQNRLNMMHRESARQCTNTTYQNEKVQQCQSILHACFGSNRIRNLNASANNNILNHHHHHDDRLLNYLIEKLCVRPTCSHRLHQVLNSCNTKYASHATKTMDHHHNHNHHHHHHHHVEWLEYYQTPSSPISFYFDTNDSFCDCVWILFRYQREATVWATN
jgi:hypothetical protein